jgi:hypothetical protein
LTYPEDYFQQPQYPQQGYGQRSRPGEPWQPQQYNPVAHQQRIEPQQRMGPQQQGPVGQQNPWDPQPWQQQSAMPPPTPMGPGGPRGPKRRSWPARHKVLSGLIGLGALIVIIVAATASNKPQTTVSDTAAAGASAAPSTAASTAAARSSATARSSSAARSSAAARSSTAAKSAPSAPATPASSSMTDGQQQAVDSAEDYLSEGQGFSKQGLLNQLTSSFGEGFPKSDAEFAIKYLNPNWDEQAVDSASGYLSEGQGFSKQGLLQQLTSTAGEGFTEGQAAFAIDHLHPDWDAQAVAAAKSYLGDGEGFSRSGLIEQLTSSYGAGFTQAQAEYAVNKVMPLSRSDPTAKKTGPEVQVAPPPGRAHIVVPIFDSLEQILA